MTDTTTLTTVIYDALTNAPRRRPDGKRFGTIEADHVRTDAVLHALAAAGLPRVGPRCTPGWPPWSTRPGTRT
jgi:hypothetical protein